MTDKEETTTVEEAPKGRTFPKVKKPSAAAFGTESTLDEEGRVLETKWKDSKGNTVALPFTEPGQATNNRNLYTVKAISPDGVLVQLPLENQINNNTASPEDLVGLRLYQRKGYTILFDMTLFRGVYCPAADCWAPWLDEHRGACSGLHERQLNAQKDNAGNFSQGVTTSSTWRR